MAEKKNNEFEYTLEDILKPEDPDTKSSCLEGDQEELKRNKPLPSVPQKNLRKYPRWLDTIIRIAAIIVVCYLLLMFALSIVTR